MPASCEERLVLLKSAVQTSRLSSYWALLWLFAELLRWPGLAFSTSRGLAALFPMMLRKLVDGTWQIMVAFVLKDAASWWPSNCSKERPHTRILPLMQLKSAKTCSIHQKSRGFTTKHTEILQKSVFCLRLLSELHLDKTPSAQKRHLRMIIFHLSAYRELCLAKKGRFQREILEKILSRVDPQVFLTCHLFISFWVNDVGWWWNGNVFFLGKSR